MLNILNNATLIPKGEDARSCGWPDTVLGNLAGIGRPAEGAALIHVFPCGKFSRGSVEAEFVPQLGGVIK